jgi:hypothetical protein
VAVHPGLVDTALARGYFKQTAPRALRPLTDPFFDHLFCPHLLRRCGPGQAVAERSKHCCILSHVKVCRRICSSCSASFSCALPGRPLLCPQPRGGRGDGAVRGHSPR